MLENYTVYSTKNLSGEISVPGDKSISHRSLILLSISTGKAKVENFLESDDCKATCNILQKLGVKIYKDSNYAYTVEGVGLNGLKAPKENLDCENSGTSMRLLSGLLSAQIFPSFLVGDNSLHKRPMDRIAIPLIKMGAVIKLSDKNTAPIKISPSKKIISIEYNMEIDSAQVKSAIILLALYALGKSKITEKQKTRDHTENILKYLGVDITKKENTLIINPPKKLVSKDITVPGDISSAMFFIVAGLITKESKIKIKNVGLNPTRIGGIEILKMMGANIEIIYKEKKGPEEVGDIIASSSNLKGIIIPKEYIANAIDEFPIILIAAACASGKTTLVNAKELRFKESDRLLAMSKGLKNCKIKNNLRDDGIEIFGGKIHGGNIDSYDDHRIAMAFSIAGIVSEGSMKILNTKNISTSFPNFYDLMSNLGIKCEKKIES